jgi:chromosome partitioning protein
MAAKRYVIGVLGQKGGVAKTTLATNLAAAAQIQGKSTLLIDLDPQGSATGWASRRDADSKLAKIECRSMPGTVLTPETLRKVSEGFQFVVLDGPAKSDSVTHAAAKLADVLVLPVRPGAFDLWAWNQTMTVVERADRDRRTERKPPSHKLVVLCCVRPRTRMALEAREVLSKEAPGKSTKLAATEICERTAYVEAAAAGESVVTWRDRAAAVELRSLYVEVLEMVT